MSDAVVSHDSADESPARREPHGIIELAID
jgi:hypothetical protein